MPTTVQHSPSSTVSRWTESTSAHQLGTTYIASSPSPAQGALTVCDLFRHLSETYNIAHRTIVGYPSAPDAIFLSTSLDHGTAALSPATTAAATTLTSSRTAHVAAPSSKALGKRKRRQTNEHHGEISTSPSKLSRLSAWRKHAGRYILPPVL